jgi:hypothetical protein
MKTAIMNESKMSKTPELYEMLNMLEMHESVKGKRLDFLRGAPYTGHKVISGPPL